jgi:hypothetical protein
MLFLQNYETSILQIADGGPLGRWTYRPMGVRLQGMSDSHPLLLLFLDFFVNPKNISKNLKKIISISIPNTTKSFLVLASPFLSVYQEYILNYIRRWKA